MDTARHVRADIGGVPIEVIGNVALFRATGPRK
jgi:hypothetical protein